jgi:hypothetical protein
MKNTLKLVGIAIAVLLTFGLVVGCGPLEEDIEPTLSVTVLGEKLHGPITPTLTGDYYEPGAVITANFKDYTGSETPQYWWFKVALDGTFNWEPLSLNNPQVLGAAGTDTLLTEADGLGEARYAVIVKYGDEQTKPSNTITVMWAPPPDDPGADPNAHAKFHGTYKFDPDAALSDTSNRATLEQTIVLTEDRFLLTDNSTYNDKLDFTIYEWTQVTIEEGNFSNGTSGDYGIGNYKTAFPKGFTLYGKTESGKGYGTPSRFNIYFSEDEKTFVRTSAATSGAKLTLISCVYKYDGPVPATP